jgi:hypothetical protein
MIYKAADELYIMQPIIPADVFMMLTTAVSNTLPPPLNRRV